MMNALEPTFTNSDLSQFWF